MRKLIITTLLLAATNSYAQTKLYTPTLTSVANISASTAHESSYVRIGDFVIVQGSVDIDPNATNTLTQLKVSLPIDATFSSQIELSGNGTNRGIGGTFAVTAYDLNSTPSSALIEWTPTENPPLNRLYKYTFIYRVPTVHTDDEYAPSTIYTSNVTSYAFGADNYYYRIGNAVTVWGKVFIQATAVNTLTVLTFDIPYDGNFTSHYQASGTGVQPESDNVFAIGSSITTDPSGTNNAATIAFKALDTNNNGYYFHFSYMIQ